VLFKSNDAWKKDYVRHAYAIGIFNTALVLGANLHATVCAAWIFWFLCFIFQSGKSGVFLHASSHGHVQILLQPVMDFHRHYLVWGMQIFMRKMHNLDAIIETI